MIFSPPHAEFWAPDGSPVDTALARTTHMGVGAHQDDLEIMCLEGILAGFGSSDQWFTGVVVTDGVNSARDALYRDYTGEQMRAVRNREQKKAAFVGEFSGIALLGFPSSAVKDPANREPEREIAALLEAARPRVLYTHNLADKHPTHIGVAMQTMRAIRSLPLESRPERVYGCEVWRDLDWMLDEDKVVFQLDQHENIANALVGVFDSQIVGGKQYDAATMGRRRANATYYESHSVDQAQMVNFAMDLTPLAHNDSLDISEYVLAHIDRFAASVRVAIEPFR